MENSEPKGFNGYLDRFYPSPDTWPVMTDPMPMTLAMNRRVCVFGATLSG